MSPERLVIVGGGPAGLAAARGYRDAGGTGTVTLVAAEAHRPYRRPPLTKEYLRGELEPAELPLEPAEWFHRRHVRVAMAAPATGLDLERRALSVERLGELTFDRLVIATGARPARPPIEGVDDPRVHAIRTVESADALRSAADTGKRVTVVGSGFIGCEAAASLAMRGNDVTLLTDEPAPQAARLGAEVGERIAGWLRDVGVTLRTGRELSRLVTDGDRVHVLHDAPEANVGASATVAAPADTATHADEPSAAEPIAADVVLLALGIEPNAELAASAGLELDGGRIACDTSGATSVEGVFAAGDVARLLNPAAGRRLTVEHWGEALAQGEVAGRAAAGAPAPWDAVPGFWSTIGERTLKQAAWGDGYDEVRLVDGERGGWTAWHGRQGQCVGVVAHERDEDYERGIELVAAGAPLP